MEQTGLDEQEKRRKREREKAIRKELERRGKRKCKKQSVKIHDNTVYWCVRTQDSGLRTQF